MAVLVVAYPTLSQTDYTWIQALRAQHDSQHPLIPPHFTLVFPTEQLDPAAMLEHVELGRAVYPAHHHRR